MKFIEPTENTAPPLRRLEEGQVGADDLLARGRPGVVVALLVDRLIGRVVEHGAADDDGMMRRAQARVGAVELMAGRAAAHEAALAELAPGFAMILDPLAHECDARIENAVEEGVGKALVFALRAEADADQRLRRAAEPSPQAAIGAVERVIAFAGSVSQRRMPPSARRSSKAQGPVACGTTFQ